MERVVCYGAVRREDAIGGGGGHYSGGRLYVLVVKRGDWAVIISYRVQRGLPACPRVRMCWGGVFARRRWGRGGGCRHIFCCLFTGFDESGAFMLCPTAIAHTPYIVSFCIL